MSLASLLVVPRPPQTDDLSVIAVTLGQTALFADGSCYTVAMLHYVAFFGHLAMSASVLTCGSEQPVTKTAESEQPVTNAEESEQSVTGTEALEKLDTKTEEVDLKVSSAASAINADTGNRLEVTVQIAQDGDEYVVCGQPAVMDPFGNLLQVLYPRDLVPGIRASYQYAFIAPTAGQYVVAFDNRECNVRLTSAMATVTWTIYRR